MADVTTPIQEFGMHGTVPEISAGRGLTMLFLRRLLSCLKAGSLTVILPGGAAISHRTGQPGPDAVLTLHHRRALRRLVLGGDVAFAEAYIRGDWSSPDVTALIELAARNGREIVDRLAGAWPQRFLNWLSHHLHANTKAGARRNIAFHYDLGNDFYRHWLCNRMIYSAALYQTPGDSLEEAQERKLQAVVEALDLSFCDSVLEIGCGWGALAVKLARRHQVLVTGVTLSKAQLAEASRVAQDAGVWESTDLRLQDYRDIGGQYDRIVSIEMIEAVGERFLPSYFRTLAERLKPGGRAVIQAITIAEERFEAYRAHPDFIQRYIFPGGFLPTRSLIAEGARQADLKLTDTLSFGASYALTLRDWRARFEAAWPEIEKLGYGEEFRRMWTYYLSYCEAGFRAGALDVGLYTLQHAGETA
jgi:cyclopropane-fatty-acyl-phospholipid synthase